MARIRTLKPELLEDMRTASLSDAAFRLFVSAVLLADDHGNLRADERWLDGQIWWARGDSRKSAAALQEVSDCELACIYRVRGQVYMSIRGWTKHQRIDNAGKPRVPLPSDPDAEVLRNFAANRRETPPDPDLRPPTSDQDHDHEMSATPTRGESPQAALVVVGKSKSAAKPKEPKTDWTPDEIASAMDVLARLTARNGIAYRGSAKHLGLIIARQRHGVTADQLKAVIGYCAIKLGWLEKPAMVDYLRPETLFGPESIERYLDAACTWARDELEEARRRREQTALALEAS